MSRYNIQFHVILNMLIMQAITVGCSSAYQPDQISQTIIPLETNSTVITTKPTQKIITQTPEPTTTPEPFFFYESISPDQRWESITIHDFYNGEERAILRISNDSGKVVWEAENEVIEYNSLFDYSFPAPFYWTKDGRYLYFVHRFGGDGCYGGNEHLGIDVKKIDLFTGKVSYVSPGGTYLSFSPNEKYLATLSYSEEGITIKNLINNDTKTYKFAINEEDYDFEIDQKYITWSPDSNSLVYVIMEGVCDGVVESYFNWIVRVDLKSQTQRLLTEKDEKRYIPIAWTELDKILVRDFDGNLWWMNPNTSKITSVEN